MDRDDVVTDTETSKDTTNDYPERSAVSASVYTFDQLADIYNQARVDYIVPMPMNGKRMKEYVVNYDVSLEASVVTLNDEHLETGVGMLGLREDRGWITRLGVLPHRRKGHLGQFMMDSMLNSAKDNGASLVQLEVIAGNEPAHKLFLKCGFEETRELLVIRRPPGMPEAIPEFDELEPQDIPEDEIPTYLERREPGASWVEETASLLNAGSLQGVRLDMPNGDTGWVVFQKTAFQMMHFVLSANMQIETATALLYHVHKQNAMQDSKKENLPVDHPMLSAFEAVGYFEAFRRVEMFLYF